jgi:hypothetical protein
MVILWMLHPPTVDAGTAALLASFVTMFIKMSADAIGYQYNSSAGSDKKDDAQAKVASTLAAAVPVAAAAIVTPVTSWWTLLTDAERFAIEAAAPNNARLTAFITAAKVGKATTDDLNYLVQRSLLTQPRADTIAASV